MSPTGLSTQGTCTGAIVTEQDTRLDRFRRSDYTQAEDAAKLAEETMSTDRNSLSGTDAPSASDWLSAALAQIRRVEAAPLPAKIGALLDGAAADTPDRIALHVIESGERISYSALRERVDLSGPYQTDRWRVMLSARR